MAVDPVTRKTPMTKYFRVPIGVSSRICMRFVPKDARNKDWGWDANEQGWLKEPGICKFIASSRIRVVFARMW